MAKTTNPFWNFDMTKVMADFNPAKFADEFGNIANQYKLPGLDVEALMQSQKKNIEALAAANRTAVEGMQAIYKRQTEILQQTIEEATTAVGQLGKSGTPQEATARQAELIKDAYNRAFANMRELAELAAKSSNEACETINARIAESLEEIKERALKTNDKK